MPMQYNAILMAVERIVLDEKYIFLIFAQNIDCGYRLEPPHRWWVYVRTASFNEHPQSMLKGKIKKNNE